MPGDQTHRFVIHDRDTIYSEQVDRTLEGMGLVVLKTPARVPQANAFCETSDRHRAPRVPGLRDRAQRATSPCCPSRVDRSLQSWASPCELRTRHSREVRPCAAVDRASAPGRAGCNSDSHSGRSSSRVPSHATSGVTTFEWPAQVFADHRYAHLSPAYLSAEVGLLDQPAPTSPSRREAASAERARKGQRAPKRDHRPAKVVEFPKGIGSPVWTTFATGSSLARDGSSARPRPKSRLSNNLASSRLRWSAPPSDRGSASSMLRALNRIAVDAGGRTALLRACAV